MTSACGTCRRVQSERSGPLVPCNLQWAAAGNRTEAPVYAGTGSGTADAHGTGMIDLLLVLATAAFFGLSWGYAHICERL